MKSFKQHILTERASIKVFYHGVDMDGTGSAYAAWKKFGSKAKYIPADYGKPLDIKAGDEVYMLDFSTSKQELLKFAEIASKITVIDHHQTAKSNLSGKMPSNVKVIFNMKKAGAVLSWEYFHKKKVPKILLYIQDRDLWTWKLPNSKGVNEWLFRLGSDFKALDKLPPMKEIIATGQELERKGNEKVAQAMTTMQEVEFAGYVIGLVKAESRYSEIGHQIAKKYPFGIIRRRDKDNKNNYKYDLRSQGSFDVSKIATKYGGGGHRNAAGFTWPKNKPLFKEL